MLFQIRLVITTVVFTTVTVPSSGSLRKCPGAWCFYEPENVCITRVARLKTWGDARQHCQILGGDLVQIMTKDMEDFVNEIRSRSHNYWIGVRDLEKDGVFEYVNGSKLRFLEGLGHWQQGPCPCEGGPQHCVMRLPLPQEGMWMTANCSSIQGFICETEPDTPNQCDVGWRFYSEGNVCIGSDFNLMLSWYDARKHCQSFGGDLVQIWNKDKNDFVTPLKCEVCQPALGQDMPPVSLGYWIGLSDPNKINVFEYLNGTKLLDPEPGLGEFGNFTPYNEERTNHCVLQQTGDNGWRNENCTERYMFICGMSPPYPRNYSGEYCSSRGWNRVQSPSFKKNTLN